MNYLLGTRLKCKMPYWQLQRVIVRHFAHVCRTIYLTLNNGAHEKKMYYNNHNNNNWTVIKFFWASEKKTNGKYVVRLNCRLAPTRYCCARLIFFLFFHENSLAKLKLTPMVQTSIFKINNIVWFNVTHDEPHLLFQLFFFSNFNIFIAICEKLSK